MKKIWYALTQLGISENLDSREARRICYVNYIALLTSMYLMARILFSLSNIVYCIKLFSMNLFVISVLLLNRYHFYRMAKMLTFTAWVAGIAFFSYFYLGGFNGGAFVVLFSAVPWPFMLFDYEQNRSTIRMLLGCLFLCFTLLIILHYVRPLPVTVELNMDLVRISTTVLTILIILLLTWYFHSSHLNAEITLRREKEKSEKAKTAAEAANRAKSAFLANMSHELRTPLNAIMGFSELMQRDPVISKEQQRNLETIGRSGKHLLSLINDVLEVSSEVGKGTCFTFDLRLQLAQGTDLASHQLYRRVIGLAAGQPVLRLLVVEDNDVNRNLLLSLLQSVGFDVRKAVNGREAVAIWQKWRPHLIWMDIRMPVMDGYEATAIIRSEMQRTRSETDTKIIALTANAFEEDRLRVIEHGGNDFIRKPFRESEIFEILHKHLGVRYVFEQGKDLMPASPVGA